MRYDTPVYFRLETEGKYNEETGDYEDGTVTEKRVWASVSNTNEDMQKIIYGALKQGSITMHIQNRYKGTFSNIRIGDKLYAVDYRKRLRVREVYVLSEILQ